MTNKDDKDVEEISHMLSNILLNRTVDSLNTNSDSLNTNLSA